MNRLAFNFTLKALEQSGAFHGLAAAFNNVDLGGDRIIPGAFRRTLQEKGASLPILWAHDQSRPIGVGKVAETAEGLAIDAQLVTTSTDGKDAYELLRAGAMKGLSIGFRTVKDRVLNEVRELLDVDLFECSLCAIPMNPLATVTAVKAGDISTIRQFEGLLREVGFSRSQAKNLAMKGWAGLNDTTDDEEAIAAWLTEHTARLRA